MNEDQRVYVDGDVLWEIVIDLTRKQPNDGELGKEVRDIVLRYAYKK